MRWMLPCLLLFATTSEAWTLNPSQVETAYNTNNIWLSSTAWTNGVKQSAVVLSSRTVPAGKVFSLKYIDVSAFMQNVSSNASTSMGTVSLIQGPGSVVLTTMTFIHNLGSETPPWRITIDPSVQFSSFSTISLSVSPSTGATINWGSNMIGGDR